MGLFRHLRPMNSGPRLIMGALRPRRPAQPATNPCARFRLYNPMSTASRSVFLAKPRYLTLASRRRPWPPRRDAPPLPLSTPSPSQVSPQHCQASAAAPPSSPRTTHDEPRISSRLCTPVYPESPHTARSSPCQPLSVTSCTSQMSSHAVHKPALASTPSAASCRSSTAAPSSPHLGVALFALLLGRSALMTVAQCFHTSTSRLGPPGSL